MLTPYRNLSGHSGVIAYEAGPDFIRVQFHGSSTVYVYTDRTPGRAAVEHMKRLAADGKGLSTYIAQDVGNRYERKE